MVEGLISGSRGSAYASGSVIGTEKNEMAVEKLGTHIQVVPMQRFGYLLAFTMITSALGAITLLPALILVTRARFIGEFDWAVQNISRRINGLKTFSSMKNNFMKSEHKDK